ncbi:MAG TPA: hypothetical protein VNM90_25420 [Haliangium sp.]|nr:hypothetical protein [Haliangium sp.]
MNVLLLSEDGSDDARPTLIALAKKMMQLVDGQCRTNALRFEPPEEATVAIVKGNLWKSTNRKDEQKVRALRRMLATRLAEEPRGFVLFHIDGDRRWSERALSENRAQFKRVIEDKVREVLAHEQPRWTSAELDRCMSRLIVLVPFYSIEAWVYQNIERGRALCRRHHGERHRHQFDGWERDRTAIDEIEKPKETGCLQSKFNRELAESAFPHQAACDAGASFQAAVQALAACEDLRDALRATWQPPGARSQP